MADDRFNLDPLLQGTPEPRLVTVRMRRFPFLRNRRLLYSPAPAAVLLLLEKLIKTPICRNLPRRLPDVLLDGSDLPVPWQTGDLSQSLYVGCVVLIFQMGKNQPVVILCQANNGAKLTIRIMLAFLDDSDIRFVKRINPALSGRTS